MGTPTLTPFISEAWQILGLSASENRESRNRLTRSKQMSSSHTSLDYRKKGGPGPGKLLPRGRKQSAAHIITGARAAAGAGASARSARAALGEGGAS